jgi:hypothetical protein
MPRLPNFEVHNQTLLDALWKLARDPVTFGFGFEEVLKNKLSDPEIPDPQITLQLENKSMREVFDALCQADSRYTWSIENRFVNFYPRDVSHDSHYLFNRKLVRLELKDATDVQDGLRAIVRQLPPPAEQIAQAQIGGADPYPPAPWSVTFQNLTVRQVVNRVATHGGQCAVWIFGGAQDFRSFGFFNTNLCSKAPPPWAPQRVQPQRAPPQP